jgi:hypothetical protein
MPATRTVSPVAPDPRVPPERSGIGTLDSASLPASGNSLSGLALSRALLDQGVTRLAVPAGTLAVYLVIAALVGVLAAVGPARRASRVDVLRAVTTE